MAINLLTAPDLFALTAGGRCLFDFQASSRVIIPGVHAVNSILFGSPVPDGTTLVLGWAHRTLQLSARTIPTEPDEFPAGDGSPAYVAGLVDWFGQNYAFREDFTLSTSVGLGNVASVDFTSKNTGPAYNFVSIASPPSITIATVISGVVPQLRERHAVYVELWLGNGSAPTGVLAEVDAQRVYSGYIEFDEQGLAQLDAGSVLHDQLTPDWPAPGNTPGIHSIRPYFLQYAESYGFPTRVGQLAKTDTLWAVLGGANYAKKAGVGLSVLPYAGIQPSQDMALRLGSTSRYVRVDEPQYLSFINQRATVAGMGLKVLVLFSDNTSQSVGTLVPKRTMGQGEKLCFAVGFTQLDLASIDPTKTVKEYYVQLATGANNVVQEEYSKTYRYIVDYQYQPYVRYFIYLNSLGCYDTLTTFGKGSSELKRFSEQAQRAQIAGYDAREGQFIEYNIALQLSQEVTTGYRSATELVQWADFYRSPSKFAQRASGKLDPIGLVSESIQQATDGDNTFAHRFAYIRLYQDSFFSEEPEADSAPPTGFAPAGSVAVTINTSPTVDSVDSTVPDVIREVTPTQISHWQQAYGWGNHQAAGYLNAQVASSMFLPRGEGLTVAQAALTYATPAQVNIDRATSGNNSTNNTLRVGTVEFSLLEEAEEADQVAVLTELPDGRFGLGKASINALPGNSVHVRQRWNDPVNQKGYKALVSEPLSTSGTYDSIIIEGMMGPWEGANKTYIRLTASNRGLINTSQPTLEVNYELWGPNVDFAIRARRLQNGTIEWWGYSPTGVSATNLTITIQQGSLMNSPDGPVVTDIFADPVIGTLVFDSLDTITYKPDFWLRANAAEFRGRAMIADRYYALAPRNVDAETFRKRGFLASVWHPITKEMLVMSVADFVEAQKPPAPTPPQPPVVADQTITVGIPFSLVIPPFVLAEGRTLSMSQPAGLPAGLAYNRANRTLSGSATGANSFNVSITDTDSAGESGSVRFTITVNPAPASALAVAAPIYNCQTGAITFRATGGTFNGSGERVPALEYQANGVTDWSPEPNHFVEPGPRGDAESLFLQIRQGNTVATRTFGIRAYCATSPTPGSGGGGTNSIPVLSIQPPNIRVRAGDSFRFFLPLDTFIDADNDALTYSSAGAYSWFLMVQGTGYAGSSEVGAPGIYYSGTAPAGVAQTITEGLLVTDNLGGNNLAQFQIEVYLDAPAGPQLAAAEGRFYLAENFFLDASIQVRFSSLPAGTVPQLGIQTEDAGSQISPIVWFNFEAGSGQFAGPGQTFTPGQGSFDWTRYYRYGSRSTTPEDIRRIFYHARPGADGASVLLYSRNAAVATDTGIIALNTAPGDASPDDEVTGTYVVVE